MKTIRIHTDSYSRNFAARLIHPDGSVEIVAVPNAIAADQAGNVETVFEVLSRVGIVEAVIDAEATGIGTAGKGDLTIRYASPFAY